ncbi:6394_t:CDS:2 [Acaulospora colombiana]|uniref:6394_t:CDS:1 n=1 Tax=Acaulospora colombiana TaxID=27376 RepID=A0ACA9MQ06_9GLOM|nr:6394_t:CDS:2 [Acaulospora colombiana]
MSIVRVFLANSHWPDPSQDSPETSRRPLCPFENGIFEKITRNLLATSSFCDQGYGTDRGGGRVTGGSNDGGDLATLE